MFDNEFTKYPIVSARLTPDERAVVETLAKLRRCSVSKLVRSLVVEGAARQSEVLRVYLDGVTPDRDLLDRKG